MADDFAGDDPEARASELVRKTIQLGQGTLSDTDCGTVVEALAEDLRTVSADAALAEERLAQVETQTRVLAEAVIAINETISETPDTLAPAVQAVKDEM